MQYDASTPAEYLDMLEPDWRKDKLLEIRALVHKHAPDLKEGIAYKMLGFSDGKGGGFVLNAQKASVNFYVGNISKVDPDGSLLKGFDMGKGCIRFKKSVVVANTRFEEFLIKASTMLREGKDIGC